MEEKKINTKVHKKLKRKQILIWRIPKQILIWRRSNLKEQLKTDFKKPKEQKRPKDPKDVGVVR